MPPMPSPLELHSLQAVVPRTLDPRRLQSPHRLGLGLKASFRSAVCQSRLTE